MRLTTDGSEQITLAELVAGHRSDLQSRIELAEQRGDGAGLRQLRSKLTKLDRQAESVGVFADPNISRELAELRRTLARHERTKGAR